MIKNNPKPALLLQYIRDNLPEQEHYGFIKLVAKYNVIKSIGEDNCSVFYQRSCAKPLQASLIIDLELDKFFNLTEKEIAISCASHVGEKEHTQIIQQYLNKIGCSKNDLLCGIQSPISKKAQNELLLNDCQPDILQNNCSGKHSFMLSVCKKLDFDTKTYPQIEHPLQKMIYEQIRRLCQTQNHLKATKDGCGVPIWATTLEELGHGYLNLFTSKKYTKITSAFLNNPYIIGGQNRLDSEIINAAKNLTAKVGAGGLCVVVNIVKEQALVVKISDADLKARTLVTVFALLQLGWIDEKQIEHSDLKSIFQIDTKTLHGDIIGKAIPCFDLTK